MIKHLTSITRVGRSGYGRARAERERTSLSLSCAQKQIVFRTRSNLLFGHLNPDWLAEIFCPIVLKFCSMSHSSHWLKSTLTAIAKVIRESQLSKIDKSFSHFYLSRTAKLFALARSLSRFAVSHFYLSRTAKLFALARKLSISRLNFRDVPKVTKSKIGPKCEFR